MVIGVKLAILKTHGVCYTVGMNVSSVADLVGTSPDSLRRWTREYAAFLSPGATPPRGDERRLNEHDLRVLHFIGAARDAGTAHDKIREQLAALQKDGWAELPPLPEAWIQPPQDGRIAVSEAREESQHLAEIAAQQIVIQTLREQLQDAQGRAETLQRRVSELEGSDRTAQAEISDLRVQLEKARGEVAALQARLSGYTFTGDHPIPLALIIAVTALAVVIVVLVVFVAARLLVG
jgi:DNA-binding transcriptional MerR regulator